MVRYHIWAQHTAGIGFSCDNYEDEPRMWISCFHWSLSWLASR